MEIFSIVVLALSGLLLGFVGVMRLTKPIETYSKNSGVTLANDVDLLNEIRGASALMLLGGIIILCGTYVSDIRMISFSIAVLIFIGFLLGRVFSLIQDGKPNKLIVNGIYSEVVLGGLNLFCLINIINS
ncbi:MAG: DUF4345 domain-containing protein [Gammaproteobacteria bacterium]